MPSSQSTTIPLDDTGRFFVKTVDPRKITFDELLRFAHVALESFRHEPLTQYYHGPRYCYETLNGRHDFLSPFDEPRKRLRAYIERERCKRRLYYSYARSLHQRMIDSKGLCCVLYEKKKMPDNIVHEIEIGLCFFAYPTYMQSPREGMQATLYGLYALWLRLKYAIAEWAAYLFQDGDNPIVNRRVTSFVDEYNRLVFAGMPNSVDYKEKMASLSFEELQQAPYVKSDMVVIYLLVISPEYQGKGLGSKFLSSALDLVPNVPITFVNKKKTETSQGPQKFYVNSSNAGRGVYSKCGYSVTYICEKTLGGYNVGLTRMDMTRL